jgi:hypothetical protein
MVISLLVRQQLFNVLEIFEWFLETTSQVEEQQDIVEALETYWANSDGNVDALVFILRCVIGYWRKPKSIVG